MNEQIIMDKIKEGKTLTKDEDIFYLTKILNYTEKDALRILTIAENKDKNVIID